MLGGGVRIKLLNLIWSLSLGSVFFFYNWRISSAPLDPGQVRAQLRLLPAAGLTGAAGLPAGRPPRGPQQGHREALRRAEGQRRPRGPRGLQGGLGQPHSQGEDFSNNILILIFFLNISIKEKNQRLKTAISLILLTVCFILWKFAPRKKSIIVNLFHGKLKSKVKKKHCFFFGGGGVGVTWWWEPSAADFFWINPQQQQNNILRFKHKY